MFLGSFEDELGTGFLRSRRRFRSEKRRKVTEGRRAYIFPREGEYGCKSYLYKGYCDEEEEYSPIFEREKSGESTELPRIGCDYGIPMRPPRVRPRISSAEPCEQYQS